MSSPLLRASGSKLSEEPVDTPPAIPMRDGGATQTRQAAKWKSLILNANLIGVSCAVKKVLLSTKGDVMSQIMQATSANATDVRVNGATQDTSTARIDMKL